MVPHGLRGSRKNVSDRGKNACAGLREGGAAGGEMGRVLRAACTKVQEGCVQGGQKVHHGEVAPKSDQEHESDARSPILVIASTRPNHPSLPPSTTPELPGAGPGNQTVRYDDAVRAGHAIGSQMRPRAG
jgi:hypothetical protein